MAKLIWGIDPLAVSRMGRTAKKPPFTKKELARIGIPAHKIPRVQEELARLTADKTLTREELGRLAEEISWLFSIAFIKTLCTTSCARCLSCSSL